MTMELDPATISAHRSVSLDYLRSSRAFAHRTPKQQKDPGHISWDPRSATRDTSNHTISLLAANDDNIALHVFGPVVDVDVDTDNPLVYAALDLFLPSTPHIYGRASKPRSHRLYELDTDFDPAAYRFLDLLKKSPTVQVELRGGSASSGRYSLLPGSIHPSGELYEWTNLRAARSTPVSVPLTSLMRAFRSAIVAAFVAPLYTEGSRNSTNAALCGFLYRAVVQNEESGVPDTFNRADAEALHDGILQLAGDTEDRSRKITFEKTFDKGDAGAPITGLNTLATLSDDPNFQKLLYALLTDNQDMVELGEFQSNIAINAVNGEVVWVPTAGAKDSTWLVNQMGFKNAHLHMTYPGQDGTRKEMFEYARRSKLTTRYRGIMFKPFPPGVPNIALVNEPSGVFVNTWRGFATVPHPSPVTEEDVAPFLYYIREVWCRNDSQLTIWLLSWLASIVQDPATQPGTAVIGVGLPGAGKSFLAESILMPMIGVNHSMLVHGSKALVNNFNAHLGGMLFVTADDVISGRGQDFASAIKSMVTSSTLHVEPKGVDSYSIRNCMRLLVTSNNMENALRITDGTSDRRYTVIQISDQYADAVSRGAGKEYYRNFERWLDAGGLGKVMRYLVDYEYDPITIRSCFTTQAKIDMINNTRQGFEAWLAHLVDSDFPFADVFARQDTVGMAYYKVNGVWKEAREAWPEAVTSTLNTESYRLFRNHSGRAAYIDDLVDQRLTQKFRDCGLTRNDKGKNSRMTIRAGKSSNFSVIPFPTRAEIIKYLRDVHGYNIDDIDESPEGDSVPTGPDF